MGGKGSGRVAQPAALRLLGGRSEGRDSGGRKVLDQPRSTRGAPEAPAWITADAAAMEVWDYVVECLEPLGVLSPGHREAVACFASAAADLQRARATLRKRGRVVTNPQSGAVHPHPAVSDERNARAEIHRWAIQLGLTPASQQGVDDVAGRAVSRSYNPFAP